VLVSADLGQHASWIAEMLEVGFDQVYLHHVSKEHRDLREFIDAFGTAVLPQLQSLSQRG
jgi:hypothetical protein